MAGKMSNLGRVSAVAVAVGAFNWGLVGVGNFLGQQWDLVEFILGGVPFLRDLIYVVIGVFGFLLLWDMFRK